MLPLGGSYPSAEKQSVYSTTPADWVIVLYTIKYFIILIDLFCFLPNILSLG